jgi:uncharacterized protein YydD (DUF2326 family)
MNTTPSKYTKDEIAKLKEDITKAANTVHDQLNECTMLARLISTHHFRHHWEMLQLDLTHFLITVQSLRRVIEPSVEQMEEVAESEPQRKPLSHRQF